MFSVHRVADLDVQSDQTQWLIQDLWLDQAVGIVGGEPKCCKSFLALDLAVAVASGRRCLGTFEVPRPGPVVLFCGEDALHEVRRRIEGIATAGGISLASLDVFVITAAVLRLDDNDHQAQLRTIIAKYRPRLLVLDPFVRMHRIDENVSAEVAPLLAYLRTLQREHHTAVLLVHHARKGGAHLRGGQALRGSSELHAWGDSNLYLRRKDDTITLSIEHRSAASAGPIHLRLNTASKAVALRVSVESKLGETEPISPEQRVIQALANEVPGLQIKDIRTRCRIRTETLYATLKSLLERGLIQRTERAYHLASPSQTCPPGKRAEGKSGNGPAGDDPR